MEGTSQTITTKPDGGAATPASAGFRIQWQTPMVRMLHALTPICLASIYFFGWRSLVMLVACNLTALVVEWLFLRPYGEAVSSAALVTGTLLALSLPPSLPPWMGVVATVTGMVFGKMVFGGFGRNVFNPALVGRAFVYVSFPSPMTGVWVDPLTDAVTSATPLGLQAAGTSLPWSSLVLGTTAGSLGETCALLIVLGGLYVVWRKAANWRLVVGGLLGFLGLATVLWAAGVPRAIHPAAALLSGSFLFGLFFFVTEPISGPSTDLGRWAYGLLVGALVVSIRVWSAWPEGVMFAVLLGNMNAPLMDLAAAALTRRGTRRPASPAKEAA